MSNPLSSSAPAPAAGPARAAPARLVKRLFDILLAALLLILLAPLMACVAIAILLLHGRPVLFRQQRAGLNGRLFTLFKFRTMRWTERTGVDAVASDSQRKTRLGNLLRATSLDELPELWNVLRGEMSMVGPRPLLPEYLPHYSRRQAMRHRLRPGLTGLAQVRGRNGLSWEERFEFDIWYVENQSLWLDLRILAETALVVFRRHGNSQDPRDALPPFCGSHGERDA